MLRLSYTLECVYFKAAIFVVMERKCVVMWKTLTVNISQLHYQSENPQAEDWGVKCIKDSFIIKFIIVM